MFVRVGSLFILFLQNRVPHRFDKNCQRKSSAPSLHKKQFQIECTTIFFAKPFSISVKPCGCNVLTQNTITQTFASTASLPNLRVCTVPNKKSAPTWRTPKKLNFAEKRQNVRLCLHFLFNSTPFMVLDGLFFTYYTHFLLLCQHKIRIWRRESVKNVYF